MKAANVETQVVAKVGPAKYTDDKWLLALKDELSALRAALGREYDTQHGEQIAKTVEGLKQQVILEKSLAVAEAQGAQAVAIATLADKLRLIAFNSRKTATGELTEETRKLMLAEIAAFAATQSKTTSSELAKIKDRTDAIRRQSAAVVEGAEAERKAGLESKYAELAKQPGVTPQVIQAQRGEDEAANQQKVTQEALKSGEAYQNQLVTIEKGIAAIKARSAAEQSSLPAIISIGNLENERLRVLLDEFLAVKNLREENLRIQAEMSVQLGGAKDGVRAFFLEMQEQAKQTSKIIEETLNAALDSVSSNLAKAMTGQKTEWAKMFKSLGEEELTKTIKSALQTGLGKPRRRSGGLGSPMVRRASLLRSGCAWPARQGRLSTELRTSPLAARRSRERRQERKLPGPGGLAEHIPAADGRQ